MKKNAKQLAALALALGMTAGGMGSFQAQASSTAANEASVESLTNGKGTMNMTVEGNIKATQVKVTVPLKAAFDIDPGKCSTALDSADGLVGAGIVEQAQNYTIKNGSVIPVWVYISGISANTGADLKTITLVNKKTDIMAANSDNKVMIAIKDAAVDLSQKKITDADANEGRFWLSPNKQTGADGSVNYYLDDDGTAGSTTYGKLAADTGSVTLSVYALTKGSWSDGNKFAVTPTFTVSAKDPSI